jgi:ATP-binding cassette subfamily C protein
MSDLTRLALALFRYRPGPSVLLVVVLLAAALLEGVGLLVLLPLLQGILAAGGDGVMPTPRWLPDVNGLLPVLGFFMLVTLVQAGVRYVAEIRRSGLLLGFVEQLRLRLFNAIAHAGWAELTQRHHGEFVQVLSTEVDRVDMAVQSLLQLLTSASVAVVLLGISLRLSASVTLIALACGLLLSLTLRSQTRRASAAGEELTSAHLTLQQDLHDYLACLKTIKSHHQEDRHARRFAATLAESRKQQHRFAQHHALSQSGFRLGSAACLVAIVYAAVVHLAVPAPTLLVMVVVFARMMPMLSSLLLNWQQVAFMVPAYRQVVEVAESLRGDTPSGAPTAAVEPEDQGLPFDRSIRLREVSYAYPAQEPVLDGLDFELRAHSLTVITGPSGAGKTTLVDLLCGLLLPTAGELLVDDVALDARTRPRWQRKLAYVGQDPVLFHDTIENNLRWMRPEAGAEALKAALRQAEAGFVYDLPRGLQTVVGDRGALLSGGQRQRLALARALVSQPALLLLDEVTSALDADNAQAIMRTVVRLAGSTTVVVVTHKPADVPRADQWIRLTAPGAAGATAAQPPLSLSTDLER